MIKKTHVQNYARNMLGKQGRACLYFVQMVCVCGGEQRSGKDIREGVLVPLHPAAVVTVGTGNYWQLT